MTIETELQRMEGFSATPPSGWVGRAALLSAGSLSVGVGVIGMFVPLLPSTVFFLLAAGCFARSSPRAYRWLTTNRLFGRRLRDYREHKGATVGTKVTSLATLWCGMGAAAWFAPAEPWSGLALLAIAAGVTWHLLTLETLRRS
jgi:uncharacterized membrane protein YbaN (DUF454 family)